MTGDVSIFLSRLWPDGSAHLERFNQDTGNWETGEWGITCGTVAQPTVPIEIKPHSQQEHSRILAAFDRKVGEPETLHSISFTRTATPGRKIHIRSSLRGTTVDPRASPVRHYSFTSPEFVLVP